MPSLKVKIGHVELANPLIVGAGCHTKDGKAMVKLAKAGVAAFATKTIVAYPSPDVLPCLTTVRGGMLNSVFGTTLPTKQWFGEEIPKAKAAGLKVIANLAGTTPAEAADLAVQAQAAGADIIELPTHCSHMKEILEAMHPGLKLEGPDIPEPGPFIANLKAIKKAVTLPVIFKLSAVFMNDTAVWADAAKQGGADLVACCDALGPALAVDVETGQPRLGGPRGVGGLTGDALKPISLRMCLEVASHNALPTIGVGGVATGEDVAEYVMVGATAVEVVTAGHLRGPGAYMKILEGLSAFMERKGYRSLDDFRGLTLRKIAERATQKRQCVTERLLPKINAGLCNACGKCVSSCVYDALTVNDVAQADQEKCYGCGLCASVCPTKAISFGYYS